MSQPTSELSPPTVTNSVPIRLSFQGDDPNFTVLSGGGSFALSALFEVRLVVQRSGEPIEAIYLIGRTVTVELPSEPRAPVVNGVVRAARQVTIETAGVSRYELIVVPSWDALSLRTDCRIFKNKTAIETASTVLGRYGTAVSTMRAVDTSGLPTHEYRVQYAETDQDLVFRLFAEDGLTTYFDFFDGTTVVVMSDTTTQAPDVPFVLPFAGPSSLSPDAHHAYAIGSIARRTPFVYTVRDNWVMRPDLPALKSAPEGLEIPFERYLFQPGIGADDAELARHAEELRNAEEIDAGTLEVATTAFVPPGHRLRVIGSERLEAEGELLVVATRSTWSAAHHDAPARAQHILTCVPLEDRFVPKRPSKVRIGGIQKATIVGDGEIDCDELGRVLCAFPWDRERTVTRRVSVSQGWAGPGYGLHAHPRVGNEVLIAYLEGDPNEPVIVGRVNNAVIPPPVPLPKDKTVSLWRTRSSPDSDGYNELYMDDLAGQELVRIRAQRDFEGVTLRDSTSSVGRNWTVTVEGDSNTSTVGSTSHSAGVQSFINAPDILILGDSSLSLVTDTMRTTAGFHDENITYVKNVTAPEEYHHNSGVWQMAGGRFDVFADAIHLQAGGASIDITSGAITISIGGSSITLTGGDITAVAGMIDLNP